MLAGLALAWYARPWFQPLVYGLYTSPALVLVALLTLAALAVRSGGVPGRFTIRAVLGVGFVVVLVASVVGGWYAGATLSAETMSEVERTTALDESDPANPRIVTRSVADCYASNTLQTSRYRVTAGDITVYDGTPYWSYALAPDGFRNRYTLTQNGTVLADMTQQNANVSGTVGGNASVAGGGGANDAGARSDGGGSGSSGDGEGIVIERVNENGTVVERIVVGPNESVRIVRSANGAETITQNGTASATDDRVRPNR